MARFPRVYQKIFAGSASNNGVFGSAQDGTKVLSNDLPTLMGKPAWLTGWLSAVLGASKFPPLEEFQALHYITTSQLAYIFQQGIPEYDASTTYFTNNVCLKAGTFQLYGSVTNSNTGNALSDTANWQLLGDLSTIGSGQQNGIVNRLVNGSFRFDQRHGMASASITDDSYCFDQWNALVQTAAITVSGQTLQANGIPQNIRLTQSQASAQRMGIEQITLSADCTDMRGQKATLSGKIHCSSAQAIRYAILEWTGTANAPTSDVVNDWTSSTYTAGNFFIGSSLVVTAVGAITPAANTWTSITPLTGTLGSSLNNTIVFFWTEGTAAQNVTLDVANIQFELGTSATPFNFIPYADELLLCQEHYTKSFAPNVAPVQAVGSLNGTIGGGQCVSATTAQFLASHTFATPMWSSPAVTLYNPISANDQVYDASHPSDCSSSIVTDISSVGFRIGCATSSSSLQGDALQVHFVARMEL